MTPMKKADDKKDQVKVEENQYFLIALGDFTLHDLRVKELIY